MKTRLGRAIVPVVEMLEGRRLLAGNPSIVQPLPYTLEFDTDKGGMFDKDGQGTGFTMVQPNKNNNEYAPSLIDLDLDAGLLRVTATGTSVAGGNFEKDNTLLNGLQTTFDATAGGGFTLITRLKGPLSNINVTNNQAGIFFGPDQDNWVKLVAIQQNNGQFLQFIDEQSAANDTYLHTISYANSLYNIGNFANVETLDLELVGDAATGKVTAFYRVNGGALQKIGAELTLTGAKKTAFFNATSRAGIIAMKKNDSPATTYNFDRFEILPGTPLQNRPSVTATRPSIGDTGVPRDTFIAADVRLPTPGKGIDFATVHSDSVRLYRTIDHVIIPSVVNTSGGGDALVLQPIDALEPNTMYTFEVTDALRDTGGAQFVPYVMTFTTGDQVTPTDPNIAFEQIALPTAVGQMYTSVTFGPDGKLYASTLDGLIQRFTVNADGTLSAPQNITTVQSNNGGPRFITGIAFDPDSTANNLNLWVSHGVFAFDNATDFSGSISRLSGNNLQNYQDFVVGLPRSMRDHLNNQISFHGGFMYWVQGSNTAMGAPDNAWGLRSEHLLTSALLELNYKALATQIANDPQKKPLNVKTEGPGAYDPYAPGALLQIYATGIRNAYDMIWADNGSLYIASNGSAAGGNTPGGGGVPAITNVTTTQPDYLFKVVRGGYYGNPNPTRGEYVLNGGNPTANVDNTLSNGNTTNEVTQYPVGTQPGANYQGAVFKFGFNYSPNGSIQYKGNAFNGALKGKLLITRYSGGDDIIVLTLDANGNVSAAQSGIAGFSKFVDPLDIIEDPNTGFLYVAELGGMKLTLLRPITPGANITVSKEKFYFNDQYGNGTNSPTQTLTITNTGTQPLSLNADAFTLLGTDASQFRIVTKPSLPTTVGVGESVTVTLAMNASSAGIKAAALQIKSNDPDQPLLTITLRGIGMASLGGGNNEPSLQRVLELYQIPIVTGDVNANSTALYQSGEPLNPVNDEVAMQRLVKAGPGPITIEPIGVFGNSVQPALRFGYYDAGTTGKKTQLFTVGQADNQTVNPTAIGLTSFDPGGNSFGLYTSWPSFSNREVYSEDVFNTWDTASPHKVRFYPLKNQDGTIVPNAYVVAFEEYNLAFDSNDLIAIIRNVKPAEPGPEVGLESLDVAPAPDHLVFNRIQNPNTQFPNGVHDIATVRVRNSGNQPLSINTITVSSGWQVTNMPSTMPTSIAPGGFLDITVKFTATSGGHRQGTLQIQTDDADEPLVTVKLDGYWQSQSENNQEPDLDVIVRMFGYTTTIVGPGQKLSNKGQVEAIGDEVLSAYWQRADASLPVTFKQIAAYHTQGTASSLFYYPQGSPNSQTRIFRHYALDGQAILPRLDNNGQPGGQMSNSLTNLPAIFGLNVAGLEFSDPALNDQSVDRANGGVGPVGHHMRFWPAKDANGNIIPNTWIMGVDFSGINYDYQDNVYLITNIKPAAPAAVTGLTAADSPAGVLLDWNDNNPQNLAGYNVYRAASSGGTYTKLNSIPVTNSNFTDAFAPTGVTSFYRVTAVDNFGTESAVASTSILRSNDTTPPAAPTGVAAAGSGIGITITWSANSDSDLAGYNVYRSGTANGTYIKLTTNPLSTGTLSFVDSNAPLGQTSFYKVSAVDLSGNESAQSASANAVRPSDTVAPASPTALTTQTQGNTIVIDWANNTEPDLAGYNIYRSTSLNGTYTKLNSVPLTNSIYTDFTAPTSVPVYYRVTAVDAASNESAPSIVTGLRPDGVAPSTPTNLLVTDSAGGIVLDWSDNLETDLAGYNVYRSDQLNGTYVKVNTSGLVTASGFTDPTAPLNATSFYRVRAVDYSGNESSFASGSGTHAVADVTVLRIDAAATSPFVDSAGKTWLADTGFTGGSTSNGALDIAGTIDDALYYTRRIGTSFNYSIPVANGNYTLKLHFAEPYWQEAGKRKFNVSAEGQQILSNYDIFAEVGANTAIVKSFAVTVTDGKLDLAFSRITDNAIISAIQLDAATTPPVAPSNLAGNANGATAATITWKDNSNNETNFKVQRSTSPTFASGIVETLVGANTTTFNDSGLTGGVTYYYRVAAVNTFGDSAFTSTVSVTPVSLPTSIRVNAAGAAFTDSIGNNWIADTGFTGTSSVSTAPFEVNNTTDDALYYTRRVGTNFSYSLPVANGTYQLKLHFAEPYWQEAGKRKFNVTAEGQTILSNYDLYAEAGYQNAIVKTFNVTVTDGKLDLNFSRLTDNAIICAIELVAGSGPGLPPAAPGNLVATSVQPNRINLGWADNSGNETGFVIERSTDGTNFTPVTTTGPNATSYADTGLTPGTKYFYRVRSTNGMGDSENVGVASAITHVRVNAGGGMFTDASSNIWLGDSGFTGGSSLSSAYDVLNTTDDSLYYAYRSGSSFSFSMPVANGNYSLRLLFADPTSTAANQRRFNVVAEGQTILSNYDIVADIGAKTAGVKSFNVSVTDGKLDLTFTGVLGNAIVSGIALIPA